jgi:hypothetical protein
MWHMVTSVTDCHKRKIHGAGMRSSRKEPSDNKGDEGAEHEEDKPEDNGISRHFAIGLFELTRKDLLDDLALIR